MATVQEALQIAVDHHRNGRYDQAAALYRAVLQVDPANYDALHLLGVVATRQNQSDLAVQLIRRSIVVHPGFAESHFNLGNALRAQGRREAAVASFARAGRLDPGHDRARFLHGVILRELGRLTEAVAVQQALVAASPGLLEAINELGMLHQGLGRLDEAERWYRRLALLRPDISEAYANHGAVRHAMGDARGAERLFRRAARIAPFSPSVRKNLGVVLDDLGRGSEANRQYVLAVTLVPDEADHYRDLAANHYIRGQAEPALRQVARALRLRPVYPEALAVLGQVRHMMGRHDEAIATFEQALRQDPRNATTCNGMGSALLARGRLDEAAAMLQRAIALQPGFVEAYNNLAGVRRNQGRQDAAIACYRRSLAINPDNAMIRSNMLLTMCYHDGIDRDTLLAAHLDFARRYERPGRIATSWPDDRTPGRRLRIGYVSPDLRDHAAAYFLEPLLAHHDHQRVHVTCYAQVAHPDSMTQRLKGYADAWVDTVPLSDDELFERIRADAIDVLIDVAGHTGGNRLPVFARKPAPVQVTWLGYAATTGLQAMDYLLIDPYAILPEHERFYTETIWRLPEVYRCFKWYMPTPEVGPLPLRQRGAPTFGSFNAFVKITPACLAVWSEVLKQVPESRLVLLADAHPDVVHGAFARHGIAPERLELIRRQPMDKYLSIVTGVDIALDPFPHTGGTTSFQTLWMGTPIVTLAGDRFATRATMAILSTLGLSELICSTPEEYVATAVRLARDADRLEEMRRGLRPRMERSPFMDYRGFAATFEDALREMWRRWPERQPPAV